MIFPLILYIIFLNEIIWKFYDRLLSESDKNLPKQVLHKKLDLHFKWIELEMIGRISCTTLISQFSTFLIRLTIFLKFQMNFREIPTNLDNIWLQMA